MCEPVSIMMAGAALVGAYATYQSGQTQKEFVKYEAAQNEADAKAAEGDAKVEAERIRKAGRVAAAETRAGLAASGQDLASAGALAINREVYRGAEEDAYFALLGGRDRSARLNTDAALSRARGKAASQAGTLGAFSQALGGGAQAYGNWRVGNASKGANTKSYGKGG